MIIVIFIIIDFNVSFTNIHTINKAPKLSGHLVDLSAVIARLQTNSMNATGTS